MRLVRARPVLPPGLWVIEVRIENAEDVFARFLELHQGRMARAQRIAIEKRGEDGLVPRQGQRVGILHA